MKLLKNLLFALTLFLTSCAASHFKKAQEQNDITAWEVFLDKHPNYKHADIAQKSLDELREEDYWDKVTEADKIYAYKNFIKEYPNSRYVEYAEEIIREKQEEIDWESLKEYPSISKAETFIETYPKSENLQLAKQILFDLREISAWNMATNLNSAQGYKDYLDKFPMSKNSEKAKLKIKEIEVIAKEWEKVKAERNPYAIQNFINKYSYSEYADYAKNLLLNLETTAWSNARATDTESAYKDYLSKYPYGSYSENARARLVDLEVESIFNGPHGKMPPMQRSGYSNSYSSTNEVKVFNNTSYTLTVYYSGPESKKVVFSPKQTKNFTLAKGQYKVAASVNAADVQNYAGHESLTGGEWDIEFYIVTTTYGY